MLLYGSCKSLGYISPGHLPQRKLFDPLFFKHAIEWGGGYPRPAIEMMEGKWRADKKKNPNPNPQTFVMMKPDLNMADLLY